MHRTQFSVIVAQMPYYPNLPVTYTYEHIVVLIILICLFAVELQKFIFKFQTLDSEFVLPGDHSDTYIYAITHLIYKYYFVQRNRFNWARDGRRKSLV